MKCSVWTLGLVCVALGAAADDVAEQVRCREVGFSRSVERHDAPAFTAHLDPQARFVGGSMQRGRDEITQAWSVFLDPGGPRIAWRPALVEVLEDSGLALTRGPYRLVTADEDGVPLERWGIFSSIWRRGEDGVWRVLFDIGGAPQGEPTAEHRALLDAPAGCPD